MMRTDFPRSMFGFAGMAIKDIADNDGMVRLTISPVKALSACPDAERGPVGFIVGMIYGWRTCRQPADRWHPMENASRAFLDAVRKSMR